jgi:DNA helicase-2/ATP-dependent DNA helicase PcrA
MKGAIFETAYLDVIKEDKETEEERRENIMELVAKAEEWEKERENPTLSAFLEEIALASAQDVRNEAECVHLMTVHNGKGLEFEVVFLVGLEEELFPHINSKKEAKSLEEERRLFYVGLTRAKKKLYLMNAHARHIWGSSRFMRKSRFVSEIPKQFIEPAGSVFV